MRATIAACLFLSLAVPAVAQQTPDTTARPVAPARAPGAYMNVSFVGLFDFGWSTEEDVESLQPGDHDPHVRGFTIPNAELALDGAVDPYFKGFANIVYKLDRGETEVELEEMFFLTTALPANLQVKAGQFLAEFGRQNSQHPHSWGFADQPLVLNRLFGPEGLRSQGIRLSWLLPTSWYTEAMIAVLNAPVETVTELGDLMYVPRLASSLELSSTQTIVFGVSGAFSPVSSAADARTKTYGADVYWKWKSPTAAAGFPFVSFQSEFLTQRSESFRQRGAYAQMLWGIKPRIVAGMRAEFVTHNNSELFGEAVTDRQRFSPNLTWYPTEFSKFRAQYNYDNRDGIGRDHSVWLQFEFLLGAHAAHKF
jgi:hypothetical protein